MNAAANGAFVTIDGQSYFFETLRISASQRLETTPLYQGGAYRAASAFRNVTIYLKGRIKHEEINSYYQLLYSLLKNRKSIAINGYSYSKLILLSGKISSDEGEQYALCELTFTEVDN